MQVKVKIKDEDAQLIREQLGIDMKIAVKSFVRKATDGLVQMSLLKKSGVPIDLEKIAEEGRKLGKEVGKEARKDEAAKD